MDWLGRSMQCNFVTEITVKSCVDAQFSNKNYKEQTVNIPPNVVIEAYTFKYPKAASRNERYTNWYSMHVDCPFTKSDICLPSLSLYLGAYVSESLHLSIVVDAYGHIQTNERLTDWTCTFMHFMCGKPFFSWFTIISNARAHFALHLRKYARGNIETKQFSSPCHLPTIVCITNEMNNDEWNRYMFTTQGF